MGLQSELLAVVQDVILEDVRLLLVPSDREHGPEGRVEALRGTHGEGLVELSDFLRDVARQNSLRDVVPEHDLVPESELAVARRAQSDLKSNRVSEVRG